MVNKFIIKHILGEPSIMVIKPSKSAAENKDDLARRIGFKLKELRKSMGMTMKRLVEETGLSAPLISRIENGLVMPSVPTLEMLSNVLKIDIGYFFQKNENQEYVVSRKGRRSMRVSKRGYRAELLAEGMEECFMEPVIMTLKEKDKEEEVPLATHEGQEFIYVLEGKVELTMGIKKHSLTEGDAVYLKGSTPHKGVSLSKKPAKTLNVHLIPGRRTETFQTKD